MNPLDEACRFLGDHIAAAPVQIDVMTLYAAATYAFRQFVTFPRVLYTSEREESGKTHAMMLTAGLCASPLDASGTSYALDSALLSAANEPEKPPPTLYRDEISDVFGRSGLSGASNPVAEILRKGYKRGATRSVSVQRVRTDYSIYTPFLMTGLRTAVPRDIRSRSIVLTMQPGKPRRYYDVRESEPMAFALGRALGAAVGHRREAVRRFRARGIHPKMTGRKLEVWEPLLAVAFCVGGQAWLNRAVDAFGALALDESDAPVLSPGQMVARDCAAIAEAYHAALIPAAVLADELGRLDDPLYAERTPHGLLCLVRDYADVSSGRATVDGVQQRVYRTAELRELWDRVRPADADDAELPPDEVDDISELEEWSC